MSLARRLKQAERQELAKLSAIEQNVMAVLGWAKKILPHPVVGIVIAFLVAFAGHNELTLRSWGMLAIVVWLSIDLWAWLLRQPNRYHMKYFIGWTTTGVMLIGMMGIMWWWLDGKLKDQLTNVSQHLEFSYINSSEASNEPMGTIFTVTNRSSYEISRKHELVCFTLSAIGTKTGSNVTLLGMASFIRNGKMLLAPAPHMPPPFSVGTYGLADSTLKPGGDAQSDACLAWFKFDSTECADVTIGFLYTLENQPDIEQEKSIRYVAYKDSGGKFNWVQEPVTAYTDYCHASRPEARPPS